NPAGVDGGGDSANPVLGVVDNTSIQKINVWDDDVEVGTRQRINFKSGANIGITSVDNGTDDRIDVTIASTDPLEVSHNNILIGSQSMLNFLDTPTVTSTIENDTENHQINISMT